MFRTKQSRTEAAVDQARAAAIDVSNAAGERFDALKGTAADQASDAAAVAKEKLIEARVAATPVIQDATETPKERLADLAYQAREVAGEALHEAADRAKPKVEAAQASFVETVLPKVGAALATASAAIAAGSHQAMEAAGPHLEHAREAAYVAGDRSKDAYAVLTGEAVAKRRRSRAKWLIGIGLAAAAVAAVAAFRKQQQKADDPWATPLETSPGAAGTSGYGSTGSTLKDKAAVQVEAAKEAVTDAAAKAKEKGAELADAAKDKAGDLAAKGQSAIADAKDHSGEAVDEAKDTAADAKDVAVDAAGDAKDAAIGVKDEVTDELDGQVTAVDATPDSDAITSDAVEGGTINGASTKSSPRGSAKARLADEGDSPS
ncbi:hypothetical protein [Humibacillus xanthopallidus]|uniref:Uncharacterized protein n=1 Tax=Humibacillus xanthopallidus TaxID=412689 RepID=A0A543H9S2_9MICO|nr:hypothetical protein [Humibacillus xanthopallidus]TQM55091.1 hypothetical protein FBY41_4415 [Humibacillus xanthopallidus]